MYQVGDVVFALFRFQEGDETKERPTLVLIADLPADTALVCMITTKSQRFDTCLELTPDDFLFGAMNEWPSYVRPYRVATICTSEIRRKLGQAKPEFVEKVRGMLIKRLAAS
ncbi:MAG: type II toxin-antitoxin system PemK/MazF family toxin [Desulfovibrionaceae bacterium]